MKRYLNEALLYAVLSLVGGVFYREFTKISTGFVSEKPLWRWYIRIISYSV